MRRVLIALVVFAVALAAGLQLAAGGVNSMLTQPAATVFRCSLDDNAFTVCALNKEYSFSEADFRNARQQIDTLSDYWLSRACQVWETARSGVSAVLKNAKKMVEPSGGDYPGDSQGQSKKGF